MKNSLPTKAKRAVELAIEKGSLNWLTVIPLKELDYNLNKKEFRDSIKYSKPYVMVLGIDVIVKGNSILLPLEYAKSVIDISSIEQNLRALVVFYPILLIMPHKKVG